MRRHDGIHEILKHAKSSCSAFAWRDGSALSLTDHGEWEAWSGVFPNAICHGVFNSVENAALALEIAGVGPAAADQFTLAETEWRPAWQPIATAPLDGTFVEVRLRIGHVWKRAHYLASPHANCHTSEPGWFIPAGGNQGNHEVGIVEPVAWRPLTEGGAS